MARQVVSFGDRATQADLRRGTAVTVLWAMGGLVWMVTDSWLPLWYGAGIARPAQSLWYAGLSPNVFLTFGCLVSACLWWWSQSALDPSARRSDWRLRLWLAALLLGVATVLAHWPVCRLCHAHAMRILVSRTASTVEALDRGQLPDDRALARLAARLNADLPEAGEPSARLAIEPDPWRLAYGTGDGWLAYVPGHPGAELGGWRRGRGPSPFGRPR
ncbi:MAG: hypothetical protein HZB16_16610 [Armatimonadetes bacterium]|nr:hypothetical protein [Armatimonadota bacterium]